MMQNTKFLVCYNDAKKYYFFMPISSAVDRQVPRVTSRVMVITSTKKILVRKEGNVLNPFVFERPLIITRDEFEDFNLIKQVFKNVEDF